MHYFYDKAEQCIDASIELTARPLRDKARPSPSVRWLHGVFAPPLPNAKAGENTAIFGHPPVFLQLLTTLAIAVAVIATALAATPTPGGLRISLQFAG